MLSITSLLWFVGVVPMMNLSRSLAILLHVLCASGGGACLRVWSCPLVAKCYL